MAHSCSTFYSHPDILLKDHLRDVGKLCASYVKNCVYDERLVEVAELMGKTHDLAKYTDFFQRHLRGYKVAGQLFTHSKLSATLTAWIIAKRLADPFLASASFLCVNCHHGFLKNFSDLYDEAKSLGDHLMMHQIASIKKNFYSIKSEIEELNLEELKLFLEDPNRGISEVKTILESIDHFLWDEETCWKNYFTVLLFYSSLIDADRKDAGKVYDLINCEREFRSLPANLLHVYRERKFSGLKQQIGEIRELLFHSSEENLRNILVERIPPKIITITAPTGSGKTILGFYTALALREASSVNEETPRIIYSLPFINIIEQTYSVLRDILSLHFETVPITLLLKYHHLAFPEGRNHRDYLPLDKIFLLSDAWNSEVIVTTFEQLVRSLVGNKGSLLRKFHNLANSILILDEVQAIPLEYWKLIQEILMKLAILFNVKIIMMTATRPMIFKGDRELVPDYESLFKKLDRVSIISSLDKKLNPEEVVKFFLSKWDRKSSALMVLNTIGASRIVYEKLSEGLGNKAVRLGSINELNGLKDSTKIVLAYLSTNIVPKERGRRVNLIKDLLRDGRKIILVSTQVIEAGVDLDFDMAIRDVGPLDSIIQVSGRCNRNWKNRSKSQVYVIRVFDVEGRPEAEKIYGKVLPSISVDILKKRPIIEEWEIPAIIDEYYNEVSNRCNTGSGEYLNFIKNLAYENLSKFSLIKEEPKISIFIELDEDATEVLGTFRNAIDMLKSVEEGKLFEYKAKLRELRAELEGYIISVWPSERIGSLEEIIPKTGVYHVPRDVVPAYYNGETGFLREYEECGESYIW